MDVLLGYRGLRPPWLDSSMPFASINPIFMEKKSWEFGQKQLTIYKSTKSQIIKSLRFHPHENQLKYGVAKIGLKSQLIWLPT